jgi:hypothetical protein
LFEDELLSRVPTLNEAQPGVGAEASQRHEFAVTAMATASLEFMCRSTIYAMMNQHQKSNRMSSLKRAYADACKRSHTRFRYDEWDQWVDEAREKANGRMSGTDWRELLAQRGLCSSTSFQADQHDANSGTSKSISNGSGVALSQEAIPPSVGWGSHDPGSLPEGQFGINGIQTDQNHVPPQKAAETPKLEREKTLEQARSPGHNRLRVDSKVESMISREAAELYDQLRAQRVVIDQLKNSVFVAEESRRYYEGTTSALKSQLAGLTTESMNREGQVIDLESQVTSLNCEIDRCREGKIVLERENWPMERRRYIS